MSSILIDGGAIFTVNDVDEVFAPGYLFIEDDRILTLGQGSAPPELRERADQVIDATDMAVLPGMVNAHFHSFQTFIRGLSYDKALIPWLEETVWPAANSMTASDVYLAALVGLVESLRGGGTAVIDHQYLHSDRGNDDAACRAAEALGLRFLLARGWIDRGEPSRCETADRIMEEMERLRTTWHGRHGDRIRVEFGPAADWACSDETLRRTIDAANRWGVGTHMHITETKATLAMHRRIDNKTQVRRLADLGGLGPRTQLVHAIWLTDADIELILDSGAVVVHCPLSNMYVGEGICPVSRLLTEGIPVALGTDGPAENNGREMIDLLQVTSDLQKIAALDTPVLSAAQIFAMACRHGATAFGQPDWLGSIEPNKKADVVLLNPSPNGLCLSTVSMSAVIYGASRTDVDTVIVDGKILMRHGAITVLDEKALRIEARAAWNALRRRAGLVA